MRRELFLYLTLVCFFGLIAIFIVDGYMGIYDTVYVRVGEQSFTIEPDFWQRASTVYSPASVEVDMNAYYIYSSREDKVFFRYEVDNRWVSSYRTDIEVSIWRSQEKIRQLLLQPITVAAFDKGEWEWLIDTEGLLPGDILPEQSYQFAVIIKRGETERKIIVNINPLPYPVKPAVPAR